MAKEKQNTTKEQVGEQDELNESLRSAVGILNDIRSLNKESLNIYADQVNLSKQLYENANLVATANNAIEHHMSVASKNYGIVAQRAELIASQTEIHRDLTQEISETFADLVKNSETIADSEFERVDLSKLQNKLTEERYNLELGREVLGKREYGRESAILGMLQEKINAMKEMNSAQSRANELSQKFLGNTKLTGFAFNTMIGKIEHFVEEVGGEGLVGKFLGKKAADMLEHTKHDIQHKIVAAFQESGNAGVTAFSVTKMAAGSFVKYALPALGIAGLLGIFYGIIHAAQHLDEELSHIGKTFGVNRKEADKIHHLAVDLSKEMGVVGIRSEQVLNAFEEMPFMTNFVIPIKKGNEAAKQLLKDVTILVNQFGLSAEEVDNIRTFAAITQKPIGQLAKESAKLGKGILTTKDQMKILAKISPSIAISFKKGSQELIKAAQKAQMLGMELKEIQSFGDGILDFEQSLQNEMEARVLTGRNINFDKARELALNNDIAGLQEEMLNQLGSMNDFSKLNRIQQQSIAKSFGMEVDSVAELLAAQEKLNSLGLTQSKLDKIQAMNAADLADEMKKTSNAKLKDYLVTLAKEKESAALNERIADVTKKIKEYLTAMLWPMIEQAHYFLDSAKGAEFLQSVVSGLKVILTSIVTTVQVIAKGVMMLSKLFGGTGAAVGIILGLLGVMATYFVGKALLVKGIGLLTAKIVGASAATKGLAASMQGVEAASSGISGAAKGVSGSGGFLSGMSSFAQNAVGIAAALILFAGALWITSKAFQNFAELPWEGVLKGVAAMGALTVVAFFISKFSKTLMADGGVSTGLLLAFGAALVLFSASLLIAAKGLEVMSKINWKGFDGMFTALVKVGSSFAILGGLSVPIMLGSVALGVASAALWGFATAMSTLARSLKALSSLGDMKTVATNIASGLKEFAQIPKMLDIDSLKNSLKGLVGALKGINFQQFVALGQLAKTDMKNAGKNIVEGINSLADVAQDVDFGSGGFLGVGKTGIKASLSNFGDAIDELDLDGLKTFAELAKADMSKIGTNISKGIDSLSNIEVKDDVKQKLASAGGVLGALNNAMANLKTESLDKLKQLAQLDSKKLKDVTFDMRSVIYNLANIGANGTNGIDQLVTVFQRLSKAIDALNIDKLKNLASVNVDNLQKLRAVFQQPVGVAGTATNATTTVETETSKANAKFDKMISLLEKLTNGTGGNQPVNIVVKLGDRTLDVIATELYPKIQRRGQERATNAGGRTID